MSNVLFTSQILSILIVEGYRLLVHCYMVYHMREEDPASAIRFLGLSQRLCCVYLHYECCHSYQWSCLVSMKTFRAL